MQRPADTPVPIVARTLARATELQLELSPEVLGLELAPLCIDAVTFKVTD